MDCKENIINLIKDSDFLKILFKDFEKNTPTINEILTLTPAIKDINLLLKFYSLTIPINFTNNSYLKFIYEINNPKQIYFTNNELIIILEDLNYINSEKLIDLLIIVKHINSNLLNWCCFNIYSKLSITLKNKYDNIYILYDIVYSSIYHNRLELFKIYINNYNGIENLLDMSVCNNNGKIFNLIIKYNKLMFNRIIKYVDYDLCNKIIKYNSYDVLRFLIEYLIFYKNISNYNAIFKVMLKKSCKYGKHEVVKTLLKTKNKYFNYNELFILISCNNDRRMYNILSEHYKNN